MAEEPNFLSQIGSSIGGLLGFGGQPAAAGGAGPSDPYDMLSEAEKRRLMLGTLGQVGATLLAAGQKQMPAQRAQILSQLGNAVPNIEQAAFRSQQARLMNAQTQERMRSLSEIEGIRKQIAENPQALADRLNVDLDTIKMSSPSAIQDALRARIMQTQEQRELANLNIQQARQNLAVGKIVQAGNEVYRINPDGSFSRLTPQRELGMGEGASASQPQQQGPSTGAATISPDLDYSRAFGLKGTVNYYTGKIQGLVGGETKDTAQATKAISEINNLRNNLIAATSAEVAGKNLKATQARIAELLPEGAALFTSPQDAVNKFSTARSLIESDMKDLEIVASDRSPASPADKVKAAQAWRDLRRNRDNLNVVIGNLTGSAGAEVPGQPPAVQRQQAPNVQEGTIIRNPKTGQRKILRNGNWEDM